MACKADSTYADVTDTLKQWSGKVNHKGRSNKNNRKQVTKLRYQSRISAKCIICDNGGH